MLVKKWEGKALGPRGARLGRQNAQIMSKVSLQVMDS